MLTLLFTVVMARIAVIEKRRGWLWGLLTFTLLLLVQLLLISGYWGALLGFFLSFAAMTVVKIKYPVNKGPTLNNNAMDLFVENTDDRQDKI